MTDAQKTAADEYLAALTRTLTSGWELFPGTIRYKVFPTAFDYATFHPEDPTGDFQAYNQAVRYIASRLAANYPEISICLIEVDGAAFLQRLNEKGVQNTDETRAWYLKTL